MQERSVGNNRKSGVATLEILIAFAILVLGIGAVILLTFGNQSVAVDNETNTEAISKAGKLLEETRATSRASFASVKTGTAMVDSIYTKQLSVDDLTECKKQATSTVSWSVSPLRTQKVELTTFLVDISGFFALGGDCATDPPTKKWDNPQRFASDTVNPGKTTALDVLKGIVYLGYDKKPFLAIADTNGATLGQTSGMLTTFTNSFNDDGKMIDQINDIDVYQDTATGKIYALAALASSTAQFGIIDVTDKQKPTLLAIRQLNGVDTGGSEPDGYRIYYYNKKAYIVTRETAGPEFHIFDLTDPANPTELGSIELNSTANDFAVKNDIAYFADDSNARGELMLYDVTTPGSIAELVNARTNLAGDQDGMSIFVIGSKVYLGRRNVTSGPELYVLDNSDPRAVASGLPTLGSAEVGADVLGIRVATPFGFITTSKTNQEFQVWNVSRPAALSNIVKFNFGNIVSGGLDYEPDFIYATGDATPNFQILYSPS